MKSLNLFLLFLLLQFSCTRKKLDIEVVEVECEKLYLSDVNYELLTPCVEFNSSKSDFYTARIIVEHNNKAACLDNIFLMAEFKNEDGSAAEGTLLKDHFMLSDSEVNFSSSTFSVDVSWEVAKGDVSTFNAAEFTISTENDISQKSNKVYCTVPFSCDKYLDYLYSKIEYKLVGSMPVKNNQTVIRFYDYGDEDDDIIDVYVNSKLILENIKISAAGDSYLISLKSGKNTMVVVAKNEGIIPPNTCGIDIENSSFKLTPGLQKGQALELVL